MPVLLRPGGVTVEDLEATDRPVRRGIAHAAWRASCGHPACWRRITRRICRCGWMRHRSATMRRCWRSGHRLPGGAMPVSALARRDVRLKPRRGCSRGCAGWMRRACVWARSGIAVMPVPENGLGLAINDRLQRAAAPRAASAGRSGDESTATSAAGHARDAVGVDLLVVPEAVERDTQSVWLGTQAHPVRRCYGGVRR